MWLFSQEADLVIQNIGNRLRLYDTASGSVRQHYVERDHLSFQYTCMAWTLSVSWNEKNQSKIVAATKGGLGLLALGTDKGTISIWDLTRGVLAIKLGEGQNNKSITGIAFSADGSHAYTSSGDCDIMEWDLKTGSCSRRIYGDKHGASCISIHRGTGTLAVARTRIYLLDLSTGERIKKISSGHSDLVNCLAFSRDGRFIAAASKGSRYVNIFDCHGSKKSVLVTMALDSCPSSLELMSDDEGGSEADATIILTLLACCDTGVARIVRQEVKVTSENDSPTTASTLRVISASTSKDDTSVLAGHLLPSDQGGSSSAWRCALAYGGESKPLFQLVTYAKGRGVEQLLGQISLTVGQPESDEKQQGKKRKRNDVKALDADDPSSKKVAVDTAALNGEGPSALVVKGGNEQGRTIGSRLQEMAGALEGRRSLIAVGVGEESRKPPKADSLVTVLSQALKSSDEDLLEQCLIIHDSQVISNTVQLLPPHLSLKLVETLVKKLEKRPNRASSICSWIRCLFLHHTSYLISVPSLHQRLSGLHQITTRRVAVLPRLLGLSGRLELMLSQISKHSGGGQQSKAGIEHSTEVYVDNDEDDEEEEEEEEQLIGGESEEEEDDDEEDDDED